jgi:predicted DNA-binding protein (UPF0251 family)
LRVIRATIYLLVFGRNKVRSCREVFAASQSARKPAGEKKRDWRREGGRMRYPAAEQLEIIRLVEQSQLPACHTLAKLGIPRATFYRCYLTVPPSILVWLRRAMSL